MRKFHCLYHHFSTDGELIHGTNKARFLYSKDGLPYIINFIPLARGRKISIRISDPLPYNDNGKNDMKLTHLPSVAGKSEKSKHLLDSNIMYWLGKYRNQVKKLFLCDYEPYDFFERTIVHDVTYLCDHDSAAYYSGNDFIDLLSFPHLEVLYIKPVILKTQDIKRFQNVLTEAKHLKELAFSRLTKYIFIKLGFIIQISNKMLKVIRYPMCCLYQFKYNVPKLMVVDLTYGLPSEKSLIHNQNFRLQVEKRMEEILVLRQVKKFIIPHYINWTKHKEVSEDRTMFQYHNRTYNHELERMLRYHNRHNLAADAVRITCRNIMDVELLKILAFLFSFDMDRAKTTFTQAVGGRDVVLEVRGLNMSYLEHEIQEFRFTTFKDYEDYITVEHIETKRICCGLERVMTVPKSITTIAVDKQEKNKK